MYIVLLHVMSAVVSVSIAFNYFNYIDLSKKLNDLPDNGFFDLSFIVYKKTRAANRIDAVRLVLTHRTVLLKSMIRSICKKVQDFVFSWILMFARYSEENR